MPKTMIEGLECLRCSWKWVPQKNNPHPLVCPKCRSPYYDRPYMRKPEKNFLSVEPILKDGVK